MRARPKKKTGTKKERKARGRLPVADLFITDPTSSIAERD
jgi:hypothetical protein